MDIFHFTEHVPSVSLVLEGGKAAIETVYETSQKDIPVVLIKNSGKAADVLAYAHQHLPDKFIANRKERHPGLQSKIKDTFQISNKRKLNEFYEKIRCCMEKKEYVS